MTVSVTCVHRLDLRSRRWIFVLSGSPQSLSVRWVQVGDLRCEWEGFCRQLCALSRARLYSGRDLSQYKRPQWNSEWHLRTGTLEPRRDLVKQHMHHDGSGCECLRTPGWWGQPVLLPHGVAVQRRGMPKSWPRACENQFCLTSQSWRDRIDTCAMCDRARRRIPCHPRTRSKQWSRISWHECPLFNSREVHDYCTSPVP